MDFFGRRQKSNFLHKIVADSEGWYTKQEFSLILKRERNRSNRTGLPISYILIDLGQSPIAINKIAEKDYFEFLKKLATLISGNTRDFDVKHLIDPYQIGILLIDTSLDGAKAFIDKISQILYEYFESSKKEEYINIIDSVVISSYPSEEISKVATIKAKPVVVKDLKFENTLKAESIKTVYRQNSNFFLDWRIVSPSNGAAAISNPMLLTGSSYENSQNAYHIAKRAVDITGALLGLFLFSPLFLIIAILIKLTSKGPVLFKQERIGQYGKPFTFMKFRSMRDGCDDQIHQRYVEKLIKGQNESANLGTDEEPVYKLQYDPRVTGIGRFLRKTSLDELPQFINVLSGSMSLVGPRPPIAYEVENYKNWHLRRILEAKPGITGLWQVFGRSKTTFDDMVRLDLKYVDTQSVYLDLKIVLQTIPAILTSKSGAV